MPKRYPQSSLWLVPALLILVLALVCSAPGYAQDTGCNYDRTAPSLDNARLNFKSLNYRCAELELLERLRVSSLTLKEKADTYVLLAAVYYAMLSNEQERRDKVVEQFSAAFNEYREWKGTLDIASSDFVELMEEAKRNVDAGTAETPVTTGEPVSMAACPSATPAWISTGAFAVSTGIFVYSIFNTSSKWSDYEDDPAHSQDKYDSYKSAHSLRTISGVATLVTGGLTAYLWMKHKSKMKECNPSQGAGLQVAPTSRGVLLTYRF
jgi:hypothetical protein